MIEARRIIHRTIPQDLLFTIASGCSQVSVNSRSVLSMSSAEKKPVQVSAVSSRCKRGELLTVKNLENFPVDFMVVSNQGTTMSPGFPKILGNTGALQTDTLAEVDASVDQVVARVDKAHETR